MRNSSSSAKARAAPASARPPIRTPDAALPATVDGMQRLYYAKREALRYDQGRLAAVTAALIAVRNAQWHHMPLPPLSDDEEDGGEQEGEEGDSSTATKPSSTATPTPCASQGTGGRSNKAKTPDRKRHRSPSVPTSTPRDQRQGRHGGQGGDATVDGSSPAWSIVRSRVAPPWVPPPPF